MRPLILLIILCLSKAVYADENSNDLVVVVHKNNPTQSMTRSQVIDLFMGKYVAFPDGSKAIPLDIDSDNKTKQAFYQSLVKMSLARINAYWSRIQFTGRARRPDSHENGAAIVKFIQQSNAAIGYIHRSQLTNDLKVVYELNE